MQVNCPRCQLALECALELSGQQVTCPQCSQLIQLPVFAAPPLAYPVPPPPPLQAPQPQASFIPNLNKQSPKRRSSDAWTMVSTGIVCVLLVMMGTVITTFIVCCGMIQSAGTNSGTSNGAGNAPGAGNGSQLNEADRPHDVEMELLAQTFVRACLNGSTVQFRGDPWVVWNGNRARVVGFMETNPNTLQSDHGRWYVDFDQFGDEWKPTKVAIDGREVWRRPKGS
jgi:hypothetical protein